jgi:hypothetical protein
MRSRGHVLAEGASMNLLWGLAVLLIIMWAVGFVGFHIAGGLIHLLLVVALVVIVVNLVTGRRTV